MTTKTKTAEKSFCCGPYSDRLLEAGTAKNLRTGATADIGPGFGFYLTTYYRPGVISIACHWETFYTDSSLNSDKAEHGLLYNPSMYPGLITGNPDTVVAFEDTLGLGDRDYNDMVVGITNINPAAFYCTKVIKADLNGDCVVDSFDYAILAAHWQECSKKTASFQGLGFLGDGESSTAYDVSDDGSVVVGYSDDGKYEAFRWTKETGMVGLGCLLGGDQSWAKSVSADGSVVVGTSWSMSTEAYRWENGVVTYLGDLEGGFFCSQAEGVSADGSVIVGSGTSNAPNEAFRWENGVMTGLGFLPGPGNLDSKANAISGNETVIVGRSDDDLGSHAFVWDAEDGMRSLQDILENDNGLDLVGWKLHRALGISHDGMTIVGYGTHPDGPEAWIATVPRPDYPCNIPGDANGDCVVNMLDLAILCSYWLNCNLFPESACWK